MRFFGLSIAFLLGGALGAQAQPACPAPKQMDFAVQKRIKLSITGFTEGLEVHGNDIYESTGPMGGGTRMMRIAPDGHVTVINDPDQKYFGEGLTFLGDRVYQLSWKDHLVFVYDQDFKPVRTMKNPREGWGLTNDGHQLIFSDGSPRLFFADPEDFHVTASVPVRRGSELVDNVNELEYVDGKVYANIWLTRDIVRINPQNGCIEAEANMGSLWTQMDIGQQYEINSNADAVLNGIAYDPRQKLFYVTGKEWPMIFAGHFNGG
jgi:glutamine cyclotransferase